MPERTDAENLFGPTGQGPEMRAFKPLGERGPTVYRETNGIPPEAMAALSKMVYQRAVSANEGIAPEHAALFNAPIEPHKGDCRECANEKQLAAHLALNEMPSASPVLLGDSVRNLNTVNSKAAVDAWIGVDSAIGANPLKWHPDRSRSNGNSPEDDTADPVGSYWRIYEEELRKGIEERKRIVRLFPDEVAELDKTREWCIEKAREEREKCVSAALAWAAGIGLVIGGISGAGATATSKSPIIGGVAGAGAGAGSFVSILLGLLLKCSSDYESAVSSCETEHSNGMKGLYKKAGLPY